MIIHVPPGTPIVLRFDDPGAAEADGGQTITLLAASAPAPVTTPSRLPPQRAKAARRRTMFLCGGAGMVVAAVGMTLLNTSPHAEAIMNPAHQAAWNDTRQAMPDRMRAELAQGPTVVPPDTAPSPPGPGQPAAPSGKNPFGLE